MEPVTADTAALPRPLLAGKPAAMARWLDAQRLNWQPLWPALRRWSPAARVVTWLAPLALLAIAPTPTTIVTLAARIATGLALAWRRRHPPDASDGPVTAAAGQQRRPPRLSA